MTSESSCERAQCWDSSYVTWPELQFLPLITQLYEENFVIYVQLQAPLLQVLFFSILENYLCLL